MTMFVPVIVPVIMLMLMLMLILTLMLIALFPVNFSRQIFFAVRIDVHFGSRNSAAIYPRDLQPSSDVKRCDGFLQNFDGHTSVHQRPQKHVATHPRKTFKISYTHDSTLEGRRAHPL